MTDAATDRLRRPVLLFGGTGQVGRELTRVLHSLGTLIAPSHAEADLSRPDMLRDLIAQVRPAVIINTAALTNVDRAEREPDLAFAVNAKAPEVMADLARDVRALLVHYSTDYVFDGTKTTPYTEIDEPHPVNVYGASKLAGERGIASAGASHLILRTSWVYSRTGAGFVPTLLRQLREGGDIRIVADQTGSPTWSRALARATVRLVRRLLVDGDIVLPDESHGVYHLGGSGAASRTEIATEVIAVLAELDATSEPDRRVLPISAEEFAATARRPSYSALSNACVEATFGVTLDTWQTDLRRMLTAVD